MNLPKPLYVLVIDQEKRTAKNGRDYWTNTLKSQVGNINSIMWNAPKDAEKNQSMPHVGDFLEISDFKDQFDERGSIVMEWFSRIERTDLPKDIQSILEFTKASKEEVESALLTILDNSFWENKSHHQFVVECLNKCNMDKFKICPAATKIHHFYQGGLIIHTAEVLNLCKATVEASINKYSFANRDVVYASAILHDIGKVNTYFINDIGISQQTITEKTIGHIFYGMNIVQNIGYEWQNKINKEFINEILHCIASHHGNLEYGSIKKTQSIEAIILSQADYISSRNSMIETALYEKSKFAMPLNENFKIYKDEYFISTIGIKNYVSKIEK